MINIPPKEYDLMNRLVVGNKRGPSSCHYYSRTLSKCRIDAGGRSSDDHNLMRVGGKSQAPSLFLLLFFSPIHLSFLINDFIGSAI